MQISMARFNYWTSTLLPELILMILFVGRSLVASEKIDARVDIVVILSNGHRAHEVWDSRPVKAPYKKLATHFEMGADKARLAAVVGIVVLPGEPKRFENYPWIRMNLSVDPERYQRTVENYVTPLLDVRGPAFHYAYQWGRTFDLIRAQIFANAGSGRGKAVVFIMLSYGGHYGEDNEKAKILREDGARLYVVTVDLAAPQNPTMGGRAYNMTGDQQRVFVVNDTQYESLLVGAIDNVVNAIHRDLCQWDSACRYVDQERKQCQFEAWMPSPHPYMNKVQQCDKLKPTNETCDSLDDCKEECNKRWPWEENPCEDKCGVNDGKRRGPAPPKMENCQKSITCPPCSTASKSPTAIQRTSATSNYTVPKTNPAIMDQKTEATGANSQIILISTIVPIALLIVVIVVVAVVVALTKRARKKKRQVAAKIASTKAAVKPLLPVKSGPTGKEAAVGTGFQRGADAAVAADISMLPHSPSKKEGKKSAVAGKSAEASSSKMDSGKSAVKLAAAKSVV